MTVVTYQPQHALQSEKVAVARLVAEAEAVTAKATGQMLADRLAQSRLEARSVAARRRSA